MAKQKSEGSLATKPRKIPLKEQLKRGQKLVSQEKWQQAKQCYSRAIANYPHRWQAYESLAQLYDLTNELNEVVKLYHQGVKHNPENPQFLFALAKVLAEQQRWQAANKFYTKALKLQSNSSWGFLNWAKVLVELGKWKQAQNATLKSIRLQPDLWNAYHHLGKILQHRHRWEHALKAYEHTIKLKPDFMHGYLRMAEIHLRLQQHPQAVTCYEQVITQANNKSPVQLQAITAYEKLLTNTPETTAQQYYKFGKLCRSQSYFPQAIAACQKAIELEPQWNQPYITIQYTPTTAELRTELIDFYRQLVKQQENVPLAWGNLGDALAKQGEMTEAIECYRTSCHQRVTATYPHLAKLDWQQPKKNQPDFIIVGSAKSGTSSLYNYLSYHPQLLLSHKKELDFFWQNYDLGIEWYLAHFPSITDRPDFLTGEATPNYLRFPLVAQRIQELAPQSKLIVLLRNPVDRAISWHYHKLNTGLTQGNLADAVTKELAQLAKIDENELLTGGYRPLDNIYSSLYYYQLRAWFEYLPQEQFLFLKSEDFYQNTPQIMKQVFNFLGVPSQKLTDYAKVNAGSYNRVDDQIRQELSSYFRPHNQKLEDLLGIKFNWD